MGTEIVYKDLGFKIEARPKGTDLRVSEHGS